MKPLHLGNEEDMAQAEAEQLSICMCKEPWQTLETMWMFMT